MRRHLLVSAALRAWPALAAQAGLDPADWQAGQLAMRRDARVQRIVLQMRDRRGRALVLKHEEAPHRPDHFIAAMAAHRAAHGAFPVVDRFRVPALLAEDPLTQSCLMSHADGIPLARAMTQAGAPHAALLARAGGWVAAFHRSQFGTSRVFQPGFTLRYLRRIVAEVEDGTRAVPRRARFLAAAARLSEIAPRFDGQQTVTARPHGDLHMRNLLVGPEAVWGIDFAGKGRTPVGHDLARLLVDWAILVAPHHEIGPGEVLPRWALEAFFAGYDLTGADDPSVGMQMRLRVLAEWWAIPAAGLARTGAQRRRLRGVLSLAERVFA